jgi:hypothetical protein
MLLKQAMSFMAEIAAVTLKTAKSSNVRWYLFLSFVMQWLNSLS